jgi:transcriptional regulator with XRE-family HTH domain
VTDRSPKKDRHTLALLRMSLGKTQVEVAERAGMKQGDVSTLERRSDLKLSTLVRYVAALGGSVEVSVVVGSRRYLLDLVSG